MALFITGKTNNYRAKQLVGRGWSSAVFWIPWVLGDYCPDSCVWVPPLPAWCQPSFRHLTALPVSSHLLSKSSLIKLWNQSQASTVKGSHFVSPHMVISLFYLWISLRAFSFPCSLVSDITGLQAPNFATSWSNYYRRQVIYQNQEKLRRWWLSADCSLTFFTVKHFWMVQWKLLLPHKPLHSASQATPFWPLKFLVLRMVFWHKTKTKQTTSKD